MNCSRAPKGKSTAARWWRPTKARTKEMAKEGEGRAGIRGGEKKGKEGEREEEGGKGREKKGGMRVEEGVEEEREEEENEGGGRTGVENRGWGEAE